MISEDDPHYPASEYPNIMNEAWDDISAAKYAAELLIRALELLGEQCGESAFVQQLQTSLGRVPEDPYED